MVNSTFSVHTSKREINLAKIYLYCLPFRMFALFDFLKIAVAQLANYFDVIINIIGLIVWLQNEGSFRMPSRNRPLFNTISSSIIYLNVSSFLMAIVMYSIYGNYEGDSPFLAIIPMEVFYFHYILMFLYNIRVFTILDYGTIKKIIGKVCKVLLVLGYIQIFVMHGVGAGLYDAIVTVLGGLNKSNMLPKLCLTVSEGAGAGCLIGVFVLPFLLARINDGEKKTINELLLWLPPLYYTHSTTAYLIAMADLAVFFYISRKKKMEEKYITIAVIAVIVLAVTYVTKHESGSGPSLQYIMFEKATDMNNGSTAARNLTYGYNWGCFTEMPIMGVGNGLQGYFYNKYMPISALYIEGSDIGEFYERAQHGIANGDCFFPGYFSGYGIIGLVVLFIIISRMRLAFRSRRRNLGIFADMFSMGSIGFILLGMQGEAYCLYYAWFVLSIPFMYWEKETIIKTEEVIQRRRT